MGIRRNRGQVKMVDYAVAREALDSDLAKRCKKYNYWGTLDYSIALTFMGLTVLSAGLGTIGALMEAAKELVALASALPAILALVSSAYKVNNVLTGTTECEMVSML